MLGRFPARHCGENVRRFLSGLHSRSEEPQSDPGTPFCAPGSGRRTLPPARKRQTPAGPTAGLISVDQCAKCKISNEAVSPTTIPTIPPSTDSVIASTRNGDRMSRVLAPTAWRKPISRVLLVTDTSMMFMIPMPPTIGDTDAIAPSRIDITCPDVSWAANTSVRLRTVKPSSGPAVSGFAPAAGPSSPAAPGPWPAGRWSAP
jgi:hypothetical protein